MMKSNDEILLSGLSDNTTFRDIREAFKEFGSIERIVLISENGEVIKNYTKRIKKS
jgi:hypothetical protein